MTVLLPSMFALGFLHGLGMEHLMAITTLVRGTTAGRPQSSVFWLGLKFGLGHMSLLAVAACAGLLLRFTVPPRFELSMEFAGGLLLVALGLRVLLDLRGNRGVIHAHAHEEHNHSHMAWGLGAIFALGEIRFLLVMVPVLLAPSFGVALLCAGLFGAGLILSVSLYGLLAAYLLGLAGRDRTLDRWTGALTGTASLLMGGYWLLRSHI